MDKGPWKLLYRSRDELAGVTSDDFRHDVTLTVSGDFNGPAEFKAYCEWLASRLNSVASPEGKAMLDINAIRSRYTSADNACKPEEIRALAPIAIAHDIASLVSEIERLRAEIEALKAGGDV